MNKLITVVSETLGTRVDEDAPLMAVGFDSLSASEFGASLGIRFSSNLPSTLLFDHPTVNALSSVLHTSDRRGFI